jgi:hypothetical protein
MPEKPNLLWPRASFLAMAMTMLGHAIELCGGNLGPPPYRTIGWLSLTILTLALAIFLPVPLRAGRRHFSAVVTLCLLANFAQLVTKSPCDDISTHGELPSFEVAVVAAAFLCGVILASEGLLPRVAFAGLLLAVAYMGNWAIVNCQNPRIDVYVFQTDASASLADLRNPYDMTFPNVFAPDTSLYGKGVVRDGRLQFGYPYFPETLLAIMPASLLQFDLRYTNLVAVLLCAILIVVVSPRSLGFPSAMLFLTSPCLCFVLEKSWVEPILVLTLAATVASAVKWPRLLPFALGLLLVGKQYLPIAAVLFFAGSRPLKETLLLLIKAAAIALVITLPLALWNLSAFWHSVVELQFLQPFRPDALSYLSWVGRSFWSARAIVLIPFAALSFTMGLVLWRRRSIGFAGAVAICFLLFFAFNKQAFANYYFFVIGAMACAIVELQPRTSFAQTAAPPSGH